MRLAIVHLSDINLRADVTNAPLARVEAIVKAVADVETRADAYLLVLSGDVAFQGNEEEYALARQWLVQFREQLTAATARGEMNPTLHVVACPGDHDCDFSGQRMVRDLVLKEIVNMAAIDAEETRPLIEECTKIQQAFFAFLDGAATLPRLELSAPAPPEIGYVYNFSLAERHVQVVCLNTAWMSKSYEQPGALRFPHTVVPEQHDERRFTLVTFHHPVGWFDQNDGRAFKGRIDRLADLVLTGHDSIPYRSERSAEASVAAGHLEGAVLHDPANPNISAFGVLVVDLGARRLMHHRCEWNGARYETRRTRLSRDGGSDWEEFPLDLSRKLDIRLAPEWENELQDPGINLTHPRMPRIRLEDIFITPDLREIELRRETIRSPVRVVRGDAVIAEIARHPHVIITGDTQSGKTSFAKVLFMQFFKRGELPIMIREDSSRTIPHASQLEQFLEAAMFSQYRCQNPEVLRQFDRAKRVVIFDDSHRLSKLSRAAKNQFLRTLCGAVGRVILLAHDVYVGLDELLSPDSGVTFHRFRILPFGHISRNALVERWLTLGRESDDSADQGRELVRALHEMMQIINTLVGKNFVVPYPVYILAVLQAAEAAVNVDTKASTHGYFYELLIKASLTRGSGKMPYDIVASYLSFMAFRMLSSRVFELDRTTWQSIHDDFNRSRDLDYSFDTFQSHLQSLEIFQQFGDIYRFKYQYVFYYFLASYMRDHINRSEVRAFISAMASSLHVEMHSNVLLFLAHLSKDPFIIDEMLAAARRLFAEHAPATLDRDVEFLSAMATELAEAKFLNVFRDGNTSENRRKILEAVDRREQTDLIRETDRVVEGGAAESGDEPDGKLGKHDLDPLAMLNAALKTAQILGQIVKNFPGSLEGDQKAEIVRECTNLILRSLTWLMTMLSSDEQRIVDELMEILKDPAHPLTREELHSSAKAIVFGLASLASYGLVKRASYAVGSTLLTKTYQRVFSDGSPAQALIDASLQLDHSGAFPVDRLRGLGGKFKKGKPFAHMLLRGLVIQHFHMFPVPYDTKQRVCDALDIKYESGDKVNPRTKLLADRGT